ncbi:MAG: FKBP-type peptidyl-prolyl cis-trans isomerase [Synoicihabitans sp.]
MKIIRLFIAAVVLVGFCLPLATFAQAPESPTTASTEEARLSEAEMLSIYGWMAGMRAGISRLGLSDEEFAAFVQGVDAARSGQDLDVDLQAVGPMISEFVQAKFEIHMAQVKAAEMAKSEAYWAEILSLEGVVQLESGLAYRIIEAGNDKKPTAADTVRVHYTGKLIDGTVFDSSEGGGPFETELNRVIEGWTQGVPLIGEGGRISLYIPAELGYGDEGSGRIPPGATLIFDVELLEVVQTSATGAPTE